MKKIITLFLLVLLALACKNSEHGEETPITEETAPTEEIPQVDSMPAPSSPNEDIAFCCSNHELSHCANNANGMQKLYQQNKCVFE